MGVDTKIKKRLPGIQKGTIMVGKWLGADIIFEVRKNHSCKEYLTATPGSVRVMTAQDDRIYLKEISDVAMQKDGVIPVLYPTVRFPSDYEKDAYDRLSKTI